MMVSLSEIVIERSRKFTVLVGSSVFHVRRLPTGPKASICFDNSLILTSSSTIIIVLLMRRQWNFMYGRRRSLVSL